jgi:hypothetical protein
MVTMPKCKMASACFKDFSNNKSIYLLCGGHITQYVEEQGAIYYIKLQTPGIWGHRARQRSKLTQCLSKYTTTKTIPIEY